MPQITLSDACIAELKAALAVGSTPATVATPMPTAPTLPPAQPPFQWPATPAGDWQQQAREAAARQSYGPVMLLDWEWAQGAVTYDTSAHGGIGAGVFIASFIATGPEDGVLAQLDAIGYPSPNQGNQLTMSLSTSPCDFAAGEPAISVSYAPTLTYCVGKAPTGWWANKPQGVGLVPGVRFFVNVTGRDTYQPGVFGGPDFRVALRVPQGH